MNSRTARLSLHLIDAAEARRILDRTPDPGDNWEHDYPFEGDRAAVHSFLRAHEQDGDPGPFGCYQIRRREGGRAIGGVGFKGTPADGVVEVGYGLVPSARGHGYAAEALAALLGIAADLGVTTVRADTAVDNIASQRTLEHTGFQMVAADAELNYYEIRISQ